MLWAWPVRRGWELSLLARVRWGQLPASPGKARRLQRRARAAGGQHVRAWAGQGRAEEEGQCIGIQGRERHRGCSAGRGVGGAAQGRGRGRASQASVSLRACASAESCVPRAAVHRAIVRRALMSQGLQRARLLRRARAVLVPAGMDGRRLRQAVVRGHVRRARQVHCEACAPRQSARGRRDGPPSPGAPDVG